jgi:hypothetical protein
MAHKNDGCGQCGDAGYEYADPDEVMRLCEEAARAHLLLEIARFIRHAYRGKPSLPIEVPPLELGLIYAGKVSGGGVDAVGVYRKLDYALRGASQEAVSTLSAPPISPPPLPPSPLHRNHSTLCCVENAFQPSHFASLFHGLHLFWACALSFRDAATSNTTGTVAGVDAQGRARSRP